MSERFYLQQMEHFKVKTRFEFLTSKTKVTKSNCKSDLVDAIKDVCGIDCSKMTIPQLQVLLSSLMIYESKGVLPFDFTGSKPSKLHWQKYLEQYLGIDYNNFKNLTIETMRSLKGFLQQ